jgi:hypothetical protein
LGARVLIVAHEVFAEVLSAHALYADARKTVVGAAPTVGNRLAPTGTTAAILAGAFIVVGWAHDAFAWVATYAQIDFGDFASLFARITAPDERNQHQRADA